MNVLFEYLYRDAGNYKNWGEIVFRNEKSLSIDKLEKQIRRCLIDGEFFSAEEVKLPTFYFEQTDPELDHSWHQFWRLQETDATPNDLEGRDITELCEMFCAR